MQAAQESPRGFTATQPGLQQGLYEQIPLLIPASQPPSPPPSPLRAPPAPRPICVVYPTPSILESPPTSPELASETVPDSPAGLPRLRRRKAVISTATPTATFPESPTVVGKATSKVGKARKARKTPRATLPRILHDPPEDIADAIHFFHNTNPDVYATTSTLESIAACDQRPVLVRTWDPETQTYTFSENRDANSQCPVCATVCAVQTQQRLDAHHTGSVWLNDVVRKIPVSHRNYAAALVEFLSLPSQPCL